jgi:S1-C subfamily serine protease
MRQIKAAQDRLATGLVAFKPFARIVDDAGDCSSRSLEWHDTDRSLALKSGDGKGVQVVRAEPSGVWGLQQDDVILAVDGQPVNDVDELLQRLSASKPSEAKVRLRRGNAEQEVAIAESDYSNILDQPPAATPAK